jgi:hypothetical protein
MSKILLVEPHKVLQQALALSLFPEHEVRIEESIDAAAIDGLNDTDLLIIDAAALREKGVLTPELQRAVEASKLATLWIGADSAPQRNRLAVVGTPIDAVTLQKAVADLLSGAPVKPAAKKRAQPQSLKAAAAEAAEPQPIDLTDVVEEEPESTD